MNENIYILTLNGIVKKEFTTKEALFDFTSKQPINYNWTVCNKTKYKNYVKMYKAIFAEDPRTKAFNRMLFEK